MEFQQVEVHFAEPFGLSYDGADQCRRLAWSMCLLQPHPFVSTFLLIAAIAGPMINQIGLAGQIWGVIYRNCACSQ